MKLTRMSLFPLGATVTITCLALVGAASLCVASSLGTGEAPAISLAERRVIDIPDSQLLALSPDGASIAVSRPAGPTPTELCIHDAVTLQERMCADLGDLEARLWIDSVVWSPDGAWLAFAELWPQFFVDGDLWLLDASSGALTNLLDDGYSGDLSPSAMDGDTITLPAYPAFTADGTAVTFSRSVIQDGELRNVDVASVPIAGGDPVRVGDLGRARPDFDYWGKRWTADGSRLYVTLVAYQDTGLGPDSGIWVYEAGGSEARQLLRVDEPDGWPPHIVAVSPHGEHLLVLYPGHSAGSAMAPAYALVDGTTGAVESIEPPSQAGGASAPIIGVMLSPDGRTLMTVSGQRAKQVAVRGVTGSDEDVLMTESSTPIPSALGGEVLTWARDGAVLINGDRNGLGTLLVLESDDQAGS